MSYKAKRRQEEKNPKPDGQEGKPQRQHCHQEISAYSLSRVPSGAQASGPQQAMITRDNKE
jgi:hypothetical protein